MSTKRLATDAMFLTLALVVSYIEVLIPVPVGIPGVKFRTCQWSDHGFVILYNMDKGHLRSQ